MPRAAWIAVRDESGRTIGRARESEVHRKNLRKGREVCEASGARPARVAVLLVNAAGEVHVSRPSPAADTRLEVCLDGIPVPGESLAAAARRLSGARGEAAAAEPAILCALDLGSPGNRTRVWIFSVAASDPPAPDLPAPPEPPAPPAPAPGADAWSGYLPLDSVAALIGSGHLHPTSELVLRAVTARGEHRPERTGREPAVLCDAVTFSCLHCGQPNTVPVDPGGGQEQDLIEDCQTCCAPNRLRIAFTPDGLAPAVAVEEA